MSQESYLWKSAATGTQQWDMGLTAKPEMRILYGVKPKVSYMTGKILQMKGTHGGIRGSSRINNH